MNYDIQLEQLLHLYDKDGQEIIDKYPSASSFEKCVLLLKEKKQTYKDIQLKLGNPGKKLLKDIINKHNPDLANIDNNRLKRETRKHKPSEEEQIIRQHCVDNGKWDYDCYSFYVVENKLYMLDTVGASLFANWDPSTRKQIMNEVINDTV